MIAGFEETKSADIKFLVYQKCLVTDSAPHVIPDSSVDVRVAMKKERAMFASYITEYDCDDKTAWWFCVKDDEYDVVKLKAKQRYEITKGRRNFYVEQINLFDHEDQIYEIDKKKFAEYPKEYRPTLRPTAHEHVMGLNGDDQRIFGLFDRKSSELKGYYICREKTFPCIQLSSTGIDPTTYKNNSSAAIMDGILTYYQSISEECYLCDGARNIRHITRYQQFLCSVFNFRYAYCKMKMIYPKWMKMAVTILKPFKNILLKSSNGFLYNIACVLKMDDYSKMSLKGESDV